MTTHTPKNTPREDAAAFFRSRVIFCGMPSDNEAETQKSAETANALRNAFEKAFLGDEEGQEGGAK